MPAAQPPIQQQQFYAGNSQNQLAGLNFGYGQQPVNNNNNMWGSFASATSTQPHNNINNGWGSFTSPVQPQSNMPQGGQFFSSSNGNSNSNSAVQREPKKE